MSTRAIGSAAQASRNLLGTLSLHDAWTNAAAIAAVAASSVALGGIIAESLPILAIAGIAAVASGALALRGEKDGRATSD